MTLFPRPLLALASLSSLVLLASCGKFFVDENGGGSTTCSTNCVYIGNYNPTAADSDIAAFAAVNPLSVVSSTNVSLGDNPTSMAVTPANTYLYSSGADGAIYVFPIASGGTLGSGTAAITGTGVSFTSITVDPSGGYLIGVGTTSNATTCASVGYNAVVEIFPIDSGGALGTSPSILSATNVCAKATSVVVTPDDSYVFVAVADFGIQGFTFDKTAGTITSVSSVPAIANTSFNGLAVDANSKYLFASASGTAGGTYEFTIDPTSLPAAGTVQNSGMALYPVVVDSSNTYVYAADLNNGEVYGYTFTATGLTPISGSPFAPSSASSGTAGMVTDSSGKYVLTVSETGPNLQEYAIGSGGALSAVSTGTTGSASGYYPATIAITK
jgi:6-phosphogluconolactonase (cycloisomerase 2 family)